MERAPERVGSCGIGGRHLHSDTETDAEGRETPRETQRDTRDTDKSLENPCHRAPCTSEGEKQRRILPDTVTTMAAASLPLSSATTSIYAETIIPPRWRKGTRTFRPPGRNDSISHALTPDLMLPALCFYSILSPFHHGIESTLPPGVCFADGIWTGLQHTAKLLRSRGAIDRSTPAGSTEIASLFRSLIKITFDPKADIERGILMVCNTCGLRVSTPQVLSRYWVNLRRAGT